jgi:hypothetical protein
MASNEYRQGFGVAVDGVLQLGAGVADIRGVHEDGGDAGVDHRCLQGAQARHFQVVDQAPGREHRPAPTFLIGRWVHEFQLHFGGGKRHAIEFEAACFLDLTVRHRHVRHDGLADVGLPDAHDSRARVGQARRIDHAAGNRKRPHRRRQVAAVAAPVDERLVDGDLPEQVIDIDAGPCGRRQDHGLAGGRRGAAHAVDLLAVRVGTADHAQQQPVTRRTGNLRGLREVLQAEEHAFAGAATHVGGGDFKLG